VVVQETPRAARLAVGNLVALTQAVMDGTVQNGLAIIRPPGHHAEEHTCMGFCIYNNVAIAARLARQQMGAQRVLIVDWDVHHGSLAVSVCARVFVLLLMCLFVYSLS
jgi:acetoin utilization deacetylase AcuC-like enzyme